MDFVEILEKISRVTDRSTKEGQGSEVEKRVEEMKRSVAIEGKNKGDNDGVYRSFS